MESGKTLSNIVDSIIEYISGFQVTVDNKYDRDIIAAKVHEVREILIHDEFQSKGYVPEGFYVLVRCTSITKENMICDENDECAEIDLSVYTATIPHLIERVGWKDIKYLGTVNFTNNISRVSITGFLTSNHGRYSASKPIYTMIENGKLIFKNVECLEVFNMLCLPKIPTDICSWDDPYPSPDTFKLELIVKRDILSVLSIPADELNNTRNDILINNPIKQNEND